MTGMLERIRAVIRAAEQQHCRIRCIRLPLWAKFELLCDFQAEGLPYPVRGEAIRVCGVPVLLDTATELALERFGRQIGDPRCVSPVLH
jgi:hypothetical protein